MGGDPLCTMGQQEIYPQGTSFIFFNIVFDVDHM